MSSSVSLRTRSLLLSPWLAAGLWTLAAATEARSVVQHRISAESAGALTRLRRFTGALDRWKQAHSTGTRPALPAEVIRLAAELRDPAAPEIDAQMARIETLVQWISTLRSTSPRVAHGELVRAAERLQAEIDLARRQLGELDRSSRTGASQTQWSAIVLAAAGCAAGWKARRRQS